MLNEQKSLGCGSVYNVEVSKEIRKILILRQRQATSRTAEGGDETRGQMASTASAMRNNPKLANKDACGGEDILTSIISETSWM